MTGGRNAEFLVNLPWNKVGTWGMGGTNPWEVKVEGKGERGSKARVQREAAFFMSFDSFAMPRRARRVFCYVYFYTRIVQL